MGEQGVRQKSQTVRERSDAEKHKGGEMIPREFLSQKRDRKSDEDDERDDLLNDLELES